MEWVYGEDRIYRCKNGALTADIQNICMKSRWQYRVYYNGRVIRISKPLQTPRAAKKGAELFMSRRTFNDVSA